jgi:hypothetical protein
MEENRSESGSLLGSLLGKFFKWVSLMVLFGFLGLVAWNFVNNMATGSSSGGGISYEKGLTVTVEDGVAVGTMRNKKGEIVYQFSDADGEFDKNGNVCKKLNEKDRIAILNENYYFLLNNGYGDYEYKMDDLDTDFKDCTCVSQQIYVPVGNGSSYTKMKWVDCSNLLAAGRQLVRIANAKLAGWKGE